MNQIKLLLLAATIILSVQGCAQSQPQIVEKSAHESFYVDSVRKFSFCPLSDDSTQSDATFYEPIKAYITLNARDDQVNRDTIAQRFSSTYRQGGLTMDIDSSFTFRGKDAYMCECHGTVRGTDVEMFQFEVVTDDKVYSIMMPFSRTEYSKCEAIFRNSVLNFNFEGEEPAPQNEPRKSLFVDSIRKFSFIPTDIGQLVNDSSELIAAFVGNSISTNISVTDTRTTQEQWREQQKDLLMPNGTGSLTCDSSLTFNGQEATLLSYNVLLNGVRVDVLALSIISKEISSKNKVYTLIATGPSDRFSEHETAIRNSLLSFKLF
jgi:hypothetical protein